MEKEEDGVVVKGRATIDTRLPFRSVKEAVALFGERVLVGEIYAKQLKEKQAKGSSEKEIKVGKSKLGVLVAAELEDTKQSLKKAREEENYMANCLRSLREELEQTKRELHHLKASKDILIEHPKSINPEIEELKFVENNNNNFGIDEFQKKKFVTFASPTSLTREIIHSHDGDNVGAPSLMSTSTTPSFRKKIKKNKPIMGWIFPRKKEKLDDDNPKA